MAKRFGVWCLGPNPAAQPFVPMRSPSLSAVGLSTSGDGIQATSTSAGCLKMRPDTGLRGFGSVSDVRDRWVDGESIVMPRFAMAMARSTSDTHQTPRHQSARHEERARRADNCSDVD